MADSQIIVIFSVPVPMAMSMSPPVNFEGGLPEAL